MKVEYKSFNTRDKRSKYIAKRFDKYLKGPVLDVGCDEAVLKKIRPELNYTGIDVGGSPDLLVNLEETEKLPFKDGQFDCTLCTDVLEHLEHLHRAFGELVRVTKDYMVISLPNNWVNARKPIERGKGSFSHYGLPVEPVLDRHKWFFNLSDARKFFEFQAEKFSLKVEEMFATEKERNFLSKTYRKLRYPSQERYLNRYANTLWVVFRRM